MSSAYKVHAMYNTDGRDGRDEYASFDMFAATYGPCPEALIDSVEYSMLEYYGVPAEAIGDEECESYMTEHISKAFKDSGIAARIDGMLGKDKCFAILAGAEHKPEGIVIDKSCIDDRSVRKENGSGGIDIRTDIRCRVPDTVQKVSFSYDDNDGLKMSVRDVPAVEIVAGLKSLDDGSKAMAKFGELSAIAEDGAEIADRDIADD